MAGNTYVNITPEGKTVKKIVITVVIVLAVIILGFSSFAIVSPGHTGVVVTLDEVSDKVLEEGIHFKLPFCFLSVEQIDNRVLKTEVESNAATKDLQTISSKVSINYRVNKSLLGRNI